MNELPVPDSYRSSNASDWLYRPDAAALLETAHDWRRQHRLTSAGDDDLRTHLLLVDLQKDFCLPEGSLYVGGRSGRGAIEDSNRTARFIYRNLSTITEITCTLDSHLPFQIFFSSFWIDGAGRPLDAHRQIRAEEIRAGAVHPNPDIAWWLCNGDQEWLRRQVIFYCEELEREGKYELYLWPPHCLLGSDGHALLGVIEEARLFHAFSRGSCNRVEIKGEHVLTENYSVLAPEVLRRYDGKPLAQRNAQLLESLLDADRVIVAGQAASHCVKSTLDDLLEQVGDRERLGRFYILEDCMSAVAVPDPEEPGAFLFDFTHEAGAALERFAEAGMHVVRSTDPVAAWPDFARLSETPSRASVSS